MKRTRKINCKTYSSFAKFKKKSSATKTAKSLRTRVKGYRTRVIKKKGKYPYEVYTHRGK